MDHVERVGEPVAGAHDAHVAPHRAAEARADIDEVELALVARADVADDADVAAGRAVGRRSGDARAAPEHETLEQRVRGEAVRAVQAVAGGLARGEESGHIGAAVEVGPHAADGVVRRGHHGDRRGAGIDAVAREERREAGEPPREALLAERARVEEDIRILGLREMLDDAAAHDVARRELGERMTPLHEAPARLVDEVRALAAHGLADERAPRAGHVERRRMELHELEVRHRGARAPRHRDPVAGGDARVGGLAPELADAARREHRRPRPDDLQSVLRMMGDGAEHAVVAALGGPRGQEVEREAAVEEPDAGMRAARREQRARELAAGGVAIGVHDPPARVAALAGQREPAPFVAIEAHAELDEPLDLARSLVDERAHGVDAAQPGARGEGVGHVLRRGVVVGEHGGDPTLRPRGVGLLEIILGDDDDLAVLGRRKRRAQPRDP